MTGIAASEATTVLMPYKSMMRALCGMCPLAYEKCRITVPHTTPSPRRNARRPLGAGQIQVSWQHWLPFGRGRVIEIITARHLYN